MFLAQGNNTPTQPRIEPGSPDPESVALTIRPVRPLAMNVAPRLPLLIQTIFLQLTHLLVLDMSYMLDTAEILLDSGTLDKMDMSDMMVALVSATPDKMYL